jgi:hypothetical protein
MATKPLDGKTKGKKVKAAKTADASAMARQDTDGHSTRPADEGIRPSIRPVRVDEQGRIFEMSGDQIIVPGLEPENILAGIEDERAGRLRSLEEYLASRRKHGI